MKQTVLLCAAVLVVAAGVDAQSISGYSLPASAALVAPAAGADATTPSSFATNTDPAPPDAVVSPVGLAVSSEPNAKPDGQEPPVFSVFKSYNWQATAGYTFLRFYVLPNVTVNTNGVNLGMVWYPGGKWVGGEGEFVGTWGGFFPQGTRYAQAMGGPRFRWSAPHGLEVWGHGLVGGAHEHPQTDFGRQGAFAYEVGGGVDFNVHQRRYALRVGANMVGTRFFNTYQYSPDVSIGFVFKF
jgi:hypothetical protein